MYINERDQINYHGFLRALREMNGVSQEKVAKGVCTTSGMNRFENGNRVAEKLMRDRLTSRLGISGEKYEDYLQPKEYVRWQQRLRIVKAIERGDLSAAKEEIASYEVLPNLNCVNKQFVDTMRYIILSLESAPAEERLECIKAAVKHTVPNVNKALAGEHLLSDQELNLIAEQIPLLPAKKVAVDDTTWRIAEYEKLITYMENSRWERLQVAKVYPKVAYHICCLLLAKTPDESECRCGLELCGNAIEQLRDTSRLYYFIELAETRRALANRLFALGVEPSEKLQLEEMLAENDAWEKVFKELYAEYKVAPYMSNFCYLYYETECHDMVKVIETRRNMLGLSRVKLGAGICTDKTIIRFERQGKNPTIEMARLLFERLGLCAEYRRTRFVSNDAESIRLAIAMAKSINDRNIAEWEKNLYLLKNILDLRIKYNRQQISRYEALLDYRKGKITEAELCLRIGDAISCTMPKATLHKKTGKYFTRNEITCICDCVFEARGEISEVCTNIIFELCMGYTNSQEVGSGEIITYEYIGDGFVHYLGNKGEYETSLKISNSLLKECLTHRRATIVANILYNLDWIYKEDKNSNTSSERNQIKEILNKCLAISIFLKRDGKIAFFQRKLKE